MIAAKPDNSVLTQAKKNWHNPKIGGIREFITMFLGAFYLIASQMEDRSLSSADPNKPLGYSWSTVIATSVLAFLIAAGTTYIHFIQETFHKNYSHTDARETIELIHPVSLDSTLSLSISQSMQNLWNQVTAEGVLSPFQVFMLFVATIGHAGDFIGFITSLTDEVLEDKLSEGSLAGINIGLFLFGVIASGAEIRSCWIDMIKNNLLVSGGKMQVTNNDLPGKSDFLTIASLSAKSVQTLVANMVLYGHLFDEIFCFEKDTPIGSKIGMCLSLIFAIPIMMGTVYGQYAINFLQQGPCHARAENTNDQQCLSLDETTQDETTQLTTQESFPLLFRPLGTAGDFAAQLTELFEPFLTTKSWKIGVQLLTTFFGWLGSGSDHMNAEENLRDFKSIYKETPMSLFWSSCERKKMDMQTPLLRGFAEGRQMAV